MCTCQGPVSWRRMGEWVQAVLVACTLARARKRFAVACSLARARKRFTVAGRTYTPCDRSCSAAPRRDFCPAGCMQAVLLCGCSWTPGTCVPGRAALGSTRLAATTRPQSCLRWQPWPSTSAARWAAAGLASGAAAIGGAAGQCCHTAAGAPACTVLLGRHVSVC